MSPGRRQAVVAPGKHSSDRLGAAPCRCIFVAISSQARRADAAPRIHRCFAAVVVRRRTGRRRRRCDGPQCAGAGAYRARAARRTAGRDPAGDAGARSHVGLDLAGIRRGACVPVTRGSQVAAGTAADRTRRRHRQDRCTEAGPDRRLRHDLAALCRSCSRDTAAHRRGHHCCWTDH